MSKLTYPCDANRLRGQQTREWAKGVVEARRTRFHDSRADNAANGLQSPAIGIVAPVLIAGRDQVTPPLLTSEERGKGDSINAKMHKLIGKYRDMT